MESNYDKQVYIARELFLKYDQEEMIRKFRLEADQDWLYLVMLGRVYRVSRSSGVIEYREFDAEQDARGESRIEDAEWEVRGETQIKDAEQEVRGEGRIKGAEQEARGEGQIKDAEQEACGEGQIKNTEQSMRANESGYVECLDYQVVMTIYDVLCYSKSIPTLAHEWCPIYALQVTMSSPNTDTFTKRYAKLFSGNADRLLEVCKKLGGEQPEIRASADVCWQFSVFPFFPVQLRFWDGDEEFEPKIQLLWDKKALDFMHFETTYYVQGHLMERLAAEMGGNI